jgi:hypothetical protein
MQHDVPPLHCKQDPSEEQWGGSCLLGDADITVDTLYTSANCWPQRSGTAVKGNDVIATVDRRKLMERELSHHRRYLRRFLMTVCLANTKDKVRGNRCSCIMPCKCPAKKKGILVLVALLFQQQRRCSASQRENTPGCCVWLLCFSFLASDLDALLSHA